MRPIIFAAILLMLFSAAGRMRMNDIVTAANFSNAEFGTVAIQICIKDNQAARAAVLRYPKRSRTIVARCVRGREMGLVDG